MNEQRRRELLSRSALGRFVLATAGPAAFAEDEDGSCNWVTVHGPGGTSPICIGGDGTVVKGPDHMVGRKADDVVAEEKAAADKEAARKGGAEGGDRPAADKAAQSGQKTPAGRPHKDFASPTESQAVRDLVSGKTQHVLFTKKLGGGGRDTLLEEILKEGGRAEKPKLVSPEELKELQKKGWKVSYRGVGTAEHAEDVRTGDFFCGSGLFGNGCYVQRAGGLLSAVGIGGKTDKKAQGEARSYGDHVVAIAIPPTAKVVNLSKIEAEQKKHIADLGRRRIAGEFSQAEYEKHMEIAADVGRFAALKNYDAIYCTLGGYYNLLNRSICAVSAKNV